MYDPIVLLQTKPTRQIVLFSAHSSISKNQPLEEWKGKKAGKRTGKKKKKKNKMKKK